MYCNRCWLMNSRQIRLASLANDFKFLNDSSITSEQLIAIQYYYDLFSDILLAYDEFRKLGIDFIGMCCPDDIFPRHLLLDLAIPDTSKLKSEYRHYFIPSPILTDQRKTATHLKILFRKIVLLVKKFAVPDPVIKGLNKKSDANIRITPSMLANVPLSTKSIPYYYAITGNTDDLLNNWSPEKRLQGKGIRNLSYHAPKYNQVNEDVYAPLLYDLEPYNFLRIEGHIGKPYTHVVKNITDLRDKNRLPFDVVALSADVSAINTFLKDLGKLLVSGSTTAQATLESLIGANCNFNDLELLFDSIMSEMTGKLSNEMKFFYDLKRDAKRTPLPDPDSNVPQVPLLVKTDATFRFTTNTMGHEFEIYYNTIKDLPFIPLQVYFQSFGQQGNTDVMDFVFKAVLYYIEMLYETVTTSLSTFVFYDFYIRYYTLVQAIRYIKILNKINNEAFPLSEEENDHLDALLSISADGRMLQLYMEFLRRVLQVKIMQQAGFYFIGNPGIQHKAGVPLGGTFILVYHESEKTAAQLVAAEANNQVLSFSNESKSRILTNLSTEKKLKVDATATEHLQLLSQGVNEKFTIASERVITGLQKTIITTNFANDEKTVADNKVINTNLINTNFSKADSLSVSTTKNDNIKDINQRILTYLKEAALYLKNREDNVLDEIIADFNNGVVIADFYLPYLCCSDCPPIQMIVNGQAEPNQPPVARPGDNVSVQLPVNTVTLDGSSSSDPDGIIQSYQWELQSGPGATIENPTESKTAVSDLSEGTYVFKLTVTDNDGATDSDTVTVTVLPAVNVPPKAIAFAEPATIVLAVEGQGVSTLSGVKSNDPDGEIKSFKWSLSSGPADGAIINNPDKEKTLVTFSKTGTYVFKLIVTDDKGATDTTAVTVTVTRENLPPVAKASANPSKIIFSPDQLQTSKLDGNASTDPDGTIAKFEWSVSSGPAGGVAITNAGKPDAVATFSSPGTYVFKLIVTDDKGATDTTTVTVTVTQPNQGPVAKASANPASVVMVPGQAVTAQLDGSGSTDPDGTIKTFQWALTSTFGGAKIVSPKSAKTAVQFSQPGNFSFQLTVTDDAGSTDTATISVNVTQEIVEVKTCAILKNIITDFDKIATADTAENFKLFTARYKDIREITKFFNLMKSSDVVNMPVDAQIKFFVEQKTESQLQKWINDLPNVLLEFTELRTLSLLTFNSLTELAYFISCIQAEDVNDAKVKMGVVLSTVIEILQSIASQVANFEVVHKKIVSILASFTNDERTRLKSNGEESKKPTYVEMLKSILSAFKSMSL